MTTREQESFEIVSLQNRIDLLQQIHQEDTRRIAELEKTLKRLTDGAECAHVFSNWSEWYSVEACQVRSSQRTCRRCGSVEVSWRAEP